MLSVDIQPSVVSNKKLHILMVMASNSDIISFRNQKIYKHNNSFKRAMNELHDKGLVLIKQQRTGNLYKLSDIGRRLGRILNEIA